MSTTIKTHSTPQNGLGMPKNRKIALGMQKIICMVHSSESLLYA
jgi:hypothetical protein